MPYIISKNLSVGASSLPVIMYQVIYLPYLYPTLATILSTAVLYVAELFYPLMATHAKYLTGDKEAIKEFIGRFDVSQPIDSVITSQCFCPVSVL